MIRYLLLPACLLVSACSQQPTVPPINLVAGTYDWTFSEGCGELIVGSGYSYSFDSGCNGSTDYVASEISLSGNRLLVDQAIMTIDAAGPDAFEGIWRIGQQAARARFERR
ncbi:MAG: hypothetical protein JJ938_05235 [Roseicyclus sp.]|uniref:hypothetical protein n=1 Tax=Boseongicola sp. H5 TaxID=2763261 RepID=UPI001B1952A6|nr:hypothetical protein [Boseongicola sp. H5]MBO6602994.1 hypothetical protein [Roseicyclus sp.]MBO6624261.1 hypothetical protein [Roseicyclus sp.]MBO6921388.1 hypothetical protein [Roseicyclus sp.]